MDRRQYCECKPPINFSVDFPNYKVVVPNSHEYQFEAFIYTCVILLNYLLLTTILMIKLICFAPARVTAGDDEVKKSFDMEMLKHFREREKRKNADFEIESRRRVKEKMVNYLKSMQNIAGFLPSLEEDSQSQLGQVQKSGEFVGANASPIRRALSASGDYSICEDDQKGFRWNRGAPRSVSFAGTCQKSRDGGAARKRAESETEAAADVDPIWMTRDELKEFEGRLNRRLTMAGPIGFYITDADESDVEQYV